MSFPLFFSYTTHLNSRYSQNAFPVSGSLFTTHLLSLDALLAVVDSIEDNCQFRILNGSANSQRGSQDTVSFVSETDSGIKVRVTSEGPSPDDGTGSGGDTSTIQFAVPPTSGYGMASQVSSVGRDQQSSGECLLSFELTKI